MSRVESVSLRRLNATRQMIVRILRVSCLGFLITKRFLMMNRLLLT